MLVVLHSGSDGYFVDCWGVDVGVLGSPSFAIDAAKMAMQMQGLLEIHRIHAIVDWSI